MTVDYRIEGRGNDAVTGRPVRVIVTTDDRALALDLTRFLAAQRMLYVKLIKRSGWILSERDGTAQQLTDAQPRDWSTWEANIE